jgi:hypothetical protein
MRFEPHIIVSWKTRWVSTGLAGFSLLLCCTVPSEAPGWMASLVFGLFGFHTASALADWGAKRSLEKMLEESDGDEVSSTKP